MKMVIDKDSCSDLMDSLKTIAQLKRGNHV